MTVTIKGVEIEVTGEAFMTGRIIHNNEMVEFAADGYIVDSGRKVYVFYAIDSDLVDETEDLTDLNWDSPSDYMYLD